MRRFLTSTAHPFSVQRSSAMFALSSLVAAIVGIARVSASSIARVRLGLSVQLVVCVGLLQAVPTAHAVFTFIPLASPRTITLQVGAAGGTINNVVFNVSNANVSPTPTPVTGVPDASTPATTPAGGVRVRLRAQWPAGNSVVRLTVSSPAGLTCVGGSGCGATVIPFTTISWVAHEKVNFTTFDIQNGSFTGAANQSLASFSCCGGTNGVEMANTLIFTYSNSTLYPSGRYQGRVTYTASAP